MQFYQEVCMSGCLKEWKAFFFLNPPSYYSYGGLGCSRQGDGSPANDSLGVSQEVFFSAFYFFFVWSQLTPNMEGLQLLYSCCYGSFRRGCPQSLEQPLPLLPNSFGTRLHTHGFKTMQVLVDGMPFILGNIFQVGRVAGLDGPPEGSADSKSCVASVVGFPLHPPPPI